MLLFYVYDHTHRFSPRKINRQSKKQELTNKKKKKESNKRTKGNKKKQKEKEKKTDFVWKNKMQSITFIAQAQEKRFSFSFFAIPHVQWMNISKKVSSIQNTLNYLANVPCLVDVCLHTPVYHPNTTATMLGFKLYMA